MKKHLSLLFILTIPVAIFGQTVSKTITVAEKLYTEKSYKQSMQMLDKAKTEIESIYFEELKADLLPAKIVGYKIAEDNMGIEQSFVLGNSIQITRTFVKSTDNNQIEKIDEFALEQSGSQISITISTLPDRMCEVINTYSGRSDAMYMEAESFTPITYKDYRVVIQFNKEFGQGRFVAIIGGATIEVVGQNLDNKNELLEIANKIEIEKLIKYFGK